MGREMVLRLSVLPAILPMHSYGHDDLANSFHPNILQTKCWDNVNIMQVVSMDGSSSNGVAKLNSVCSINNFRLLPCLVGVQWDVWDIWIPRRSWLAMTNLHQPSYLVPFKMQCVAEYSQFYKCCYLYQDATILQAISLSEGAQVLQVLQAFPYCLGPLYCQVYFKLPWVEAIVKQCFSWSLHIHFDAELSLYRLVACLLCPHYLLTLCSWKPSSLTAVSPFECSACPSNVRVGVDGMSVHCSKSSVVHPAIQALSFVKQSIALSLSLLWISVLEVFLLIIQVFERLINLSIAIRFPDSVRKMRESCPGLTEQTPKGLIERSEIFQYDPMHECYVCQAREASTYSDGLLITAMKMGLFTHFGMQQRSGYSIVRVNM